MHWRILGVTILKLVSVIEGLETPEPITLVFTNRLKLRYDIFQKRLDANHSTRVVEHYQWRSYMD